MGAHVGEGCNLGKKNVGGGNSRGKTKSVLWDDLQKDHEQKITGS